MWYRTPTHPPPHQPHITTINKQPSGNPRPGQIYLHPHNHLAQHNQQLINCIQQLRAQNQEINLRIEEKLKSSRRHMERQHSPSKNQQSQSHPRIDRQSMTPEKTQQHADEQSYYLPATTSTAIKETAQYRQITKEKKQLESRERSQTKDRSNHAYRCIIDSHRRSIEEIEREGTQQPGRTTPYSHHPLISNNAEVNPQKTISSHKHAHRLVPYHMSPIKNSQMHLVYLPVPADYKQQLIEKYNRKQSEKASAQHRPTKDNNPYRADLRRSHQYATVYYPEKLREEMVRDQEERHSRSRFF